jgi:hypothetical protein
MSALCRTVNYPTLLALTRSLRVGLPAFTTRFAGTLAVPAGSAVSIGVDESLCNSFTHQNSLILERLLEGGGLAPAIS